jgi:hypothetical protein
MHVLQGYRSFLWSKLACQKCPKISQKFVRGVRAAALVVRSQILTSPYNPSTSLCITAFGSKNLQKVHKKVHTPETLCSVTPDPGPLRSVAIVSSCIFESDLEDL